MYNHFYQASFYIGLDLGQMRDHTAIAVVERWNGQLAYKPHRFEEVFVRHLERVPLGTSYPAVVERVRNILENWELAGRTSLAVDATGVGGPVVDMLRRAQLGCEITAVTMTARAREHSNGAGWNVPKQNLLAGLLVLLEQRELKIAKRLKEGGSLLRELMDIKCRQGENGRVRMGADGSGEHDDLAIAPALAVWRSKRPMGGNGGGRLPGI
jgi:phage terminase large subunit-like protein